MHDLVLIKAMLQLFNRYGIRPKRQLLYALLVLSQRNILERIDTILKDAEIPEAPLGRVPLHGAEHGGHVVLGGHREVVEALVHRLRLRYRCLHVQLQLVAVLLHGWLVLVHLALCFLQILVVRTPRPITY